MLKGDFFDMDKELDKMKESLLADIESYNKIYNDAETYEKFKKEIDTVQSNGYYCDVIFSGVFVILGIYRFITGFIDSNGLDIVGSMVLLWFVHRNMKKRAKKAYEEYENIEKYLQKQILRAQRECQVIE